MTDDMRAGDPEALQQGPTVRRLLREAHRTCEAAASGASRPVVMHEAIATVEDRLFE
jgi:hypothetical protein